MKKAAIGVAAVGAILVFRQLAQRLLHRMGEHCTQMVAQWQQMPAQRDRESEAVHSA